MKTLKSMLIFWGITLIGFYGLPFAIKNMAAAMIVLLFATPLFSFVCSLVFGIKNGFNIFYPLVTGLLYIPAIFIFYNESAWIYPVAYFIVSLIGNLIGRAFFSKHKEMKKMNAQDLGQ